MTCWRSECKNDRSGCACRDVTPGPDCPEHQAPASSAEGTAFALVCVHNRWTVTAEAIGCEDCRRTLRLLSDLQIGTRVDTRRLASIIEHDATQPGAYGLGTRDALYALGLITADEYGDLAAQAATREAAR